MTKKNYNTISDSKPIKGYIEGYYGKILNWKDRERILEKLKDCGMNAYFYAPKEDECHRKNWRGNYNNIWIKHFKNFCKLAKKKNIKIIVGISPGLDFDFLSLKNNQRISDYKILIKKIKKFFLYGTDFVSLMLDDIPNNFTLNLKSFNSEGEMHANLFNALSLNFREKIMFVPRVYANELKKDSSQYLKKMFHSLDKENNYIFYCGKKIVEDNISKDSFKYIPNEFIKKVIIWDNTYANDYCPRKLIIKPFKSKINNIMFNLTGMIETDLLLLEIIKKTQYSKTPHNDFKAVLAKNKIPLVFLDIYKYFLKENNKCTKNINEILDDLDSLLWLHKSPILLEWYPYLMGLKQDFLIQNKLVSNNRLKKISTYPLHHLIKNYL